MSTPEQTGPARPARLAGLGLLALAAIAVVIGVISLVGGNGSDPSANPPPATSEQPPASQQPTSAAPPPTSSAAPPPSSAPTSNPPSTPPPSSTSSAAPPPSQQPPPPPTPGHTQPVRVYNNSLINGLADRAAADFKGAGWNVTEVGNHQGKVPVTTVYFRPGTDEEAEAKDLARQFNLRSEPRFDGIQNSSPGIIVIVTKEYNPKSK